MTPGAGGEQVAVLFIGGYGRSGSTLLDRMLGAVDGLCSAGELRHIWQEGFVENRRCGCGARFRSCPFWIAVCDEAFGGIDRVDPAEVLAWKRRIDRWWRIPQLATSRWSASGRRDLERYRAILVALYRGIARVSGSNVVIDSTKDVSHGYVLATLRDELAVRVLHLVRDPRAVAFSWHHRQKFNPGAGRAMDRYGLVRTAVEWDAVNGLMSVLRALGPPSMLLRYEALVASPGPALGAILDLLGEGSRPVPVRDGVVELAPAHTVAGNPNRFGVGAVQIAPDEEWRRSMPWQERAVVRGLTAPAVPLLR